LHGVGTSGRRFLLSLHKPKSGHVGRLTQAKETLPEKQNNHGKGDEHSCLAQDALPIW
jgi:hypothetical protein